MSRLPPINGAASAVLALTSLQMIRTHFVEKYGVQAYLLPVAAGVVSLFLLFRLFLLWRVFREERDSGEDDGD